MRAPLTSFLTFNGKHFAERSDSADYGSIGEVLGLFKKQHNGVSLFKPDGELEAFIVNNHRQGNFVVSAGIRNGAPFYMHSTATSTEKWLGTEALGMQDEADAIREMVVAKAVDVDQLKLVLAAIASIKMGNNGYADIGRDEAVARAVGQSGFTVVASTDLHGQPTFKGFTPAAQAALAAEAYGESTYKPVSQAQDEPDYEGAILNRQERMGGM